MLLILYTILCFAFAWTLSKRSMGKLRYPRTGKVVAGIFHLAVLFVFSANFHTWGGLWVWLLIGFTGALAAVGMEQILSRWTNSRDNIFRGRIKEPIRLISMAGTVIFGVLMIWEFSGT